MSVEHQDRMTEYIVTARKWRPMKFEDVVGQSHVTVTLRNALASGRLAHAYLFSGPRGVGKTTTARLLAKAVNCLNPKDSNPDNVCENCVEITEGRSFNVQEIDGASNRSIDDIRNLREAVRYAPAKGKYKIYVIDEVHMLTKEAFNALLKTLEEPPPHVLFIFATTEIHKVPATIQSRCQRFDFRRIATTEIMANLKAIAKEEKLQLDDEALLLVAKKGDGSLRDAKSMFDQVIALCGTVVSHQQILEALNLVDLEMFFRVTDLIKTKDPAGGIALVEEIMNRGYDIKEFLSGLTEHFRNILIAKATGSTELIESSDLYRKRYAEEAKVFSMADLLRCMRFITSTESAMRYSAQPRFKLEADMVQLITMHGAPEVADLLRKIDDLKKKAPEISTLSERLTRPTPTSRPPVGTRNGNAVPPPTPAPAPTPTPAPSQPAARAINEGEIASRWKEFLGEVRKRKIALASVMDQTTLQGVQGSTIKIGCADGFQSSAVTRHKEFLSQILHELFNINARLEAVITPGRMPASPTGEPGAPAPPPEEENPIIAALKRELGAEPL
jgi:DNA polymerase-3 subunit gamma/tau